MDKRQSLGSTSGVNFLCLAIRKWINETTDSEPTQEQVKLWGREGEKWKQLCDKFTPSILEVSHEVRSAW